jgi:hypothetical protein
MGRIVCSGRKNKAGNISLKHDHHKSASNKNQLKIPVLLTTL